MRAASRKSMASSFSLSMSVWFCVPEQGMREMEILCRSSAFVVPSVNKKKFGKSFHIVTCSHVSSPWLWPKYYNQDWLKAVDHRHVFYTVEVRHEDGVFATQIDLLARSYHHNYKDLSVLHFENEESACSDLQVTGFEALNIQNKKFNTEDLLDFQGHDVFGDQLIPIPQNIPGVFSYGTNRQNFFKTANVLTSGMCGGPVVSKELINSPSSNQLIKCSNSFQVRGMVEGIIPTNYSDENLRGLACVISSDDILEFLEDVENGDATCYQGGESADFAGANIEDYKTTLSYLNEMDKPSNENDKNPSSQPGFRNGKRRLN